MQAHSRFQCYNLFSNHLSLKIVCYGLFHIELLMLEVRGQRERSGSTVLRTSQHPIFVALSAYDLGLREEQAIVSDGHLFFGHE